MWWSRLGASPAVAILLVRSPWKAGSVEVVVSQRRREILACRKTGAEGEDVVEE